MGGVNIANYSIDVDGVKWTASWDDKGCISYKGVDKDGKEVLTPPQSVVNAAKEYGASQGNGDQPFSNNPKEEELKAETLASDTVKDDFSEKGTDPHSKALSDMLGKYPNVGVVGFDPKTGNVTAKDRKGNEVKLSDKDVEIVRVLVARQELKDVMQGMKEDVKELINLPIRAVKDIYKGSKLLAQGKFRELKDRVALRVHDNLVELGVLPRDVEERIKSADERIEERLGIKNRESNPNFLSMTYGRAIRNVATNIKRLSGRTGVRAVAIAQSGGDQRGKGGYSK